LKRQNEEDLDELDKQKRSYLKRIATLNSEIEAMTLESSTNRAAAKNTSNAEDKEQIAILESQVKEANAAKAKVQAEMTELEAIMISSNEEWQARVDKLTKDKDDTVHSLEKRALDELNEKQVAWEKEKLQLEMEIADKAREVLEVSSQRDSALSQLEESKTGSDDTDTKQAAFDKRSAELEEEIRKLKDENEAEGSKRAEAEALLAAALSDKEAAQQSGALLEKKVGEQEHRINELSNKGDERSPDELVTEFVQDLFGRLHFAFVPPDSSSIDLDEAILSPNAVLKKCKKVLKQGASEFTAVPE
jgi:chromosome segregation ATPase